MLFFSVSRTLFLVWNHTMCPEMTAGDGLKSLMYGLRMDASLSGYMMMINGLLLAVSVFTGIRLPGFLINILTVIMIFLSVIIILTDLQLYHYWGFRLNTTPLFYIGKEALSMISLAMALKAVTVGLLLSGISLFCYFRLIALNFKKVTKSKPVTAVVMLLISALMILPVRGSLGTSTMNPSMVYFHPNKVFVNHAGINVVWNFLSSLLTKNSIIYPEDFLPEKQTELFFNELFPKQHSTIRLLNTAKPNILLIILESFSADIIEPLGGVKGITPNLNQLCSEGVLFTNFYASGDRTDKGLVAILSGFPAQPRSTIIKSPEKTQKLPFLSRHLSETGYYCSFIYAGDINFANYYSYLINGGFKQITCDRNFPLSQKTSKWGAHDQFLFLKLFDELNEANSLFFKTVLTLSSHDPFDVPMKKIFGSDDEDSLFLNACYYTDSHLGTFISKARQTHWWKNTLIIITADHGHRLPGNKGYNTKESFRIPMLWIGGAVAKDTVISETASQTDIPATLLAQLNSSSSDFIFSKNICGQPVNPFAVYVFNNGFGFLNNSCYYIFDNYLQSNILTAGCGKDELNYGKVFIQKMYSSYNQMGLFKEPD